MQPTSMVGVWKTVKRMNNEYLFGTLIPEMGTEVEPMSVMPDMSSEVNDLNPTIYLISTLYS